MSTASMPGGAGERAPAVPRTVWALAAVVTFGAFMSGLDTSLVNVGLATIGSDLHGDLGTTQWVASAYLLALAAALPASGWHGRRFGTGRAWVGALAAFTVTSGLCAAAWNLELLIGARILQGLAGGLLVSTGISVLAQQAGPGAMGRVLAVTGVPTVLAPAIGPTVGALLLAHVSWHWLFILNLPIGILGVVLGLRFVPSGRRQKTVPLDLIGLSLAAGGSSAVVYGITNLAERGTVTYAPTAAVLLLGLAAVIAFVRRSRRTTSPLLDLRLFGDRVFSAAACQMLFGGAALFGGQVIMPLYFQAQREQSIVATGLLLLPFGLGAAATFPFGGRLTDRYGGGRVAAAGLTLTTLTTVPMALIGVDAALGLVETLQVLRGVGLALSGAPVIATAMAAVARSQIDDASAQINVVNRIGGALGSALAVAVLTAAMPDDPAIAEVAAAFRVVFWFLTAASTLALLFAIRLILAHRRTLMTTAESNNASDPTRTVYLEGDPPMIRIAIIVGSTRPGRKADAVARWVHELACRRQDAQFDLLDLVDFPLPHLDEPRPAAHGPNHYDHDHTRAWAKAVDAYDGYVFVTPEYNHSTTGVLKNAIDFLYVEWHNKAAGFVSYGLTGGTRAVEHLRLVMGELQVADVRAQVALDLFADFDGDQLTPRTHQTDILTVMLDQTVAWSRALTAVRNG